MSSPSAGDASLPFPIYGVGHRITFPIFDADGDLVANAAGLDSEVSLDGAEFVDCANAATQIATGSGMFYLDLTAAEMTAATVAVIVKTSTDGAKTTPLVLYPRRLPVAQAGTAAGPGTGNNQIVLQATASNQDDAYNGCVVALTANSPSGAIGQARVVIDYVGATRTATLSADWGVLPSEATTYEVLVTDLCARLVPLAIGSAQLQAGALALVGLVPGAINENSVAAVILAMLHAAKAAAVNTQVHNQSGRTRTIMGDDGVTPLVVFDETSDASGNVITETPRL